MKAVVVALGAAIAVVAIGAPGRADEGFLHELGSDVRKKLDAASDARVPKPVPPQPIAVKWKVQRVDSIDLGSPLLALAAADLDGDHKPELYAVTAHDVIAIAITGGRAKELGRVAFSGEPAVPASRDVVGFAVVDAGSVVATVSSWSHGLRVSWRGKLLVAEAVDPGFMVCPGETVRLVPGRNYFGEPPNAMFGVRCAEVVDAMGNPLRVRATLAISGKLDVAVERCPAAAACDAAVHYEYPNVGFAYDIADIDRDGTPELIYSAANAPGDSDLVKVVSVGSDDKKPRLKHKFDAQGIAAIVVFDVDGNGTQEAVVAVRISGAPGIDLWRLD